MQADKKHDAAPKQEDSKVGLADPSLPGQAHTRYFESNLIQASPSRTGEQEALRFTDNTVDPNKQYSALIKKQVQGCMSNKVVSERVQVKVAVC